MVTKLCIPRLYAAASLKPAREGEPFADMLAYSAALCRGLIEARSPPRIAAATPYGYSAALCRGLIEAAGGSSARASRRSGIPRLYAAASLKLEVGCLYPIQIHPYSAALCRGLIEA